MACDNYNETLQHTYQTGSRLGRNLYWGQRFLDVSRPFRLGQFKYTYGLHFRSRPSFALGVVLDE